MEGYREEQRGEKMRVRKDQKGFTLVEVLIATAILSIVVLTVCTFIVVGSRSYATANSDINVQQEAQLALNQMSDVMIDTTRSVNYAGYDAHGVPVYALKDAEFAFTPEDKSLVMYNGVAVVDPSGGPDPIIEEGNGNNKNYHFYWDKSEETLFYAEAAATDTVPAFGDSSAEWVELASHVTDFSVDLTQVEEKRVVMLALTFVDGKKEYVTSNNVTIRNKVGVNDAELDPINRRKTISVAARDSGVIIEPGETYHFSTPKVTGENVADRSVTWSVVTQSSRSGSTTFTDDANGILQVATDEPAGTVTVKIETNAVDSDGNHASCTVDVYIKRVNSVALTKTADDNPDNGPREVSPGCTFTVSATVGGVKIGKTCNVCGEDTSIDKQVSYEGNPYGCGYIWRVYNPSASGDGQYDPTLYVEIVESAADHATFHVKDSAPTSDKTVSHGFVIQAVSLLSLCDNAKGRHYDGVPGIETGWVPGAIDFTVVKGKESAEPYKGKLKYGVNDLHEEVRAGLPTDFGKYVTAVRVKDNSGKEPDKIVLHYTTGDGANYRISPDLFDLDLNGSYTFYMQAIFPIPEDRYVPGHGGTEDDDATIWKEYYDNIQGNTASEGYTGTKYRHGKVFYAKLDRPKLTYAYKGVEYTGKNITYDPVNIFTVGLGTGIVGEIRPSKYENIVEDNSVWNMMANSLYEGDGDSLSGWNKLYYVDEDSLIVNKDNQGNESYSFNYHGKNTLADGAVQIDPRGSMFLKLNSNNHMEKACGSYHIVPGMVYKNKDPGCFHIIGYAGFDLPNLKREARYYEFDDSTIHVRITDEFTMDIDHPDFKGQAMFPLPKEMKNNPLFPNINSLDWQTTASKLTVRAKRDNSGNSEDLTFNYVRYRYIKSENAWEVEPVRHEYRMGSQKIFVHSYGIYKCGESDKKWVCIKRGGTTEKEFTIQRFDFNNGRYRADFPLPTERDFPFADGAGEIKRTLELFDSNMNQAQNVPTFLVSCKKNGEEYEIEFRTENRESEWDKNNHKIRVVSYGTYIWRPGQTEWTWTKGNSVDYKTDFVPTLKDLKLTDGITYMMDYPLPTDNSFPFKKTGDIIQCNDEKAYDQINDSLAANVKEPFKNQSIEAKYTVTGGVHTIWFYKSEKVAPYNQYSHKWKTTTYGIYDWTTGSDSWSLRSGSGEKVEFSTDFEPTLFIKINGTDYKMHFPLPSENEFPFKNDVREVTCDSWPLYLKEDEFAEVPMNVEAWAKAKCTINGDTYTVKFTRMWYPEDTVFGTFTCPKNGTEWTKVN